MQNYYEPGQWNVLCQRCGLKKKAGMLKKEWTGLRVCDECYESKHPQLLIKVPNDAESVPWSSPEPTDTFVTVTYVDPSVGKQS